MCADGDDVRTTQSVATRTNKNPSPQKQQQYWNSRYYYYYLRQVKTPNNNNINLMSRGYYHEDDREREPVRRINGKLFIGKKRGDQRAQCVVMVAHLFDRKGF